MSKIAFVDLETTGLEVSRHTVTEIALIIGNEEHNWWIELSDEELARASDIALKVNGYYGKRDSFHNTALKAQKYERNTGEWINEHHNLAIEIATLTQGHVLAGNTVHFDQRFLEAWLRKNGACPVWDYHVLDVPTYAAAYVKAKFGDVDLKPPFKSHNVSEALGVDGPENQHTAIDDARWSKAMWEACQE